MYKDEKSQFEKLYSLPLRIKFTFLEENQSKEFSRISIDLMWKARLGSFNKPKTKSVWLREVFIQLWQKGRVFSNLRFIWLEVMKVMVLHTRTWISSQLPVTNYTGSCTILRVLAFKTYLVIAWSKKSLKWLNDQFNKWILN